MLNRVMITGLNAVSAYGYGPKALWEGVRSGRSAFGPVTRFNVENRRVRTAAQLPGSPDLQKTLVDLAAPLSDGDCPVLIASHGDPGIPATRVYTSACVAASTAVADAASMIAHGLADRVVVVAGYLLEPQQFALFDAGRALATDGAVRPFSKGRTGLLLGDGVGAMLLESESAMSAPPLAWLAGWGRAGDAYHVCQPRPDGAGLAAAISSALDRAGIEPGDIGYINAHGSGSLQSDTAEAAALVRSGLSRTPISSTKSLHGQALEASPLLELIVTVLALQEGLLPANAGYLGPTPECPLDLITGEARMARPAYALSVNSAFGGANTALVVGAVPSEIRGIAHPGPPPGPNSEPQRAIPRIIRTARWSIHFDGMPPTIAGFVMSSFSPLAAAAADRCLTGVQCGEKTAIVIESEHGDVETAQAAAIRATPLLFFQAVPNAVAGYIASKHDLRGPVVCVTHGGRDVADLLIKDGDADQVLLIDVGPQQATATLLGVQPWHPPDEIAPGVQPQHAAARWLAQHDERFTS